MTVMYLSKTIPRAASSAAAWPLLYPCRQQAPDRRRRCGNSAAAALLSTQSSSPKLLNGAGESAASSSAVLSSSSYSQTPPQLPPVLPSPASTSSSPPIQQQQAAATTPSKKSAFQRLWDRYSVTGQQRRSQLAEAYFQAASRRAGDPQWYGPGRVGREFRPRHALLTMHIWFLHKRLIHDAHDLDAALMVQEELFNILWDDTTSRIRQTGTSELLVNKHLMQVQQYTFLHLTHYDHAYTDFYLQRPLERMKELRNLVSHHIFRDSSLADPAAASSALSSTTATESLASTADDRTTSDEASSSSASPTVSSDLLDRYAWYIEANYQNIMLHWPDEHYREGRVAWVNVPDFAAVRDANGEFLPDSPVHPDDVLPPPWLTNITRRGVEYYWNPETRESRWERPR